MRQYVFEIKKMRGGKFLCIVKQGFEIVATSRQTHESGEAAMIDAKEQVAEREHAIQLLDVRRVIKMPV